MKKIDVGSFMQLLNGKDEVCIENPHQHLAFRKEGASGRIFCKFHHGEEHEIPHDDEDYCECYFFPTLLTREEYDAY
ncbi:MAG: hypothetical protein K6C10_07610 [Prevotella sp.]|nr:hypothetical protein [Prevotella sp.]